MKKEEMKIGRTKKEKTKKEMHIIVKLNQEDEEREAITPPSHLHREDEEREATSLAGYLDREDEEKEAQHRQARPRRRKKRSTKPQATQTRRDYEEREA